VTADRMSGCSSGVSGSLQLFIQRQCGISVRRTCMDGESGEMATSMSSKIEWMQRFSRCAVQQRSSECRQKGQPKSPLSGFLELTDHLRENVSARCSRRTIFTVSWTSVWRRLCSCICHGCEDKCPRRMTACTSKRAKQLAQTFFFLFASFVVHSFVVRDSCCEFDGGEVVRAGG